MAERPWTWTRQRGKAAQLLADGATELFVAHELGISRNTLTAWRQRPEFVARMEEHAAKVAAALAEKSISNKQARVAALEERWLKMRAVIAARAADDSMADVPGGPTGLVVRQYKAAGKQLVEEFAVDTGLLRELRGHEEQAARELGQWIDQQRTTNDHFVRQYVGIDPDEV